MANEKRKPFRQITYDDRVLIKNLLENGTTISNISAVLGFTETTIYRELVRGGGRKNYSITTAMQNTGKREKKGRMK